MRFERYLRFAFVVLFFSLFIPALFGQAAGSGGSLRGQVTDPSGAAISGADVAMTPPSGAPIVVHTNGQGMFEFKTLPAGKYTLTVAAPGFTLYENDSVVIADQPLRLNISMTIAVEQEKVQVSDTAPTIDVNPSNNAGSIVISGKELEALPDDPDELQSDLQALAGPSAGPNGGQMYIDGFTAGQLPPKSSIREIRVNQNPFSSEYDKLGYGRIEIFTKPGTDKLHGQFMADGNDSVFNAPNPFAGEEPPYYSTQFNGSIGGPIKKNASFFFNVDRRDINELSVINAIDPNSATGTDKISGSIGNPRHRTNLGPRIDWAINKNNTLTVRYQYYRDTEEGELNNQLYLATQAYDSESTEHTLQISDTQVFGSKIVNETRFQFNRDRNTQNPNDLNPAVNVLGSFTGGGNSEGNLNDLQNNYELQNYTSWIYGNHSFKFGGRFRANQATDYTTAGFNGTFVFPGFDQYLAGTPSQLTITEGTPNASVNYFDFEPYFQDDWRVRPNITFSYGLRYETQNGIHDHNDWAPRVGFAWGVGGRSGPPKFVIRGGSGIFYDRFQIDQLLQAQHLNGIAQQEYVITNPNPLCYGGVDSPLTMPVSSCGTPTTTTATVYQLAPRLHAPSTLQSAISVERQVTKSATVAVTYLNSRGFDQFLTINANAPYPGTTCYPSCPVPTQNTYRYVSEANFKQNQLMVNSNVRVGARLQLFGYYSLNYANSDTSGVSSFPTNSYDISADYGRASFDTRNRLFLGGSIALPYLFRLSPFMVVSSGTPFNITTPYDLNGDSQYNNRPSLVSTATCANPSIVGSVYCTSLGTFDVLGLQGTPLPINYGTGPAHFVMNFRLTKTIGFGRSTKEGNAGGGGYHGPGGGGHRGGPLFGGGGPMMMSTSSDRRYNLTLGISFRNAFNNLNLSNPNGTLGSPLFGISNNIQGFPFSPGTTANRRIDLVATFSF
ncbi:MAG TPA: carboxypeptidase regulatory-like domain-containing protein [Candidatus Acidoferrales bacterium]|nr:carboxypeptidase regulatory-like domain-containing protein [Candidatus Acidoferrales bacterium]